MSDVSDVRPVAPIHRLLVANRGEIARRVFRTCRQMGIETVAVYSDADADAPFVHEADLSVPIGGAAASESYLRADVIVDAARRSGADAVHPGYGFLSENAGFARRCVDAGLVWVGPSPDAIESMGSKLAARELMIAAGVPVLPGLDLSSIADDDLRAAVEPLGLPLIVKASFGGGGRGMRVVRSLDGLVAEVHAARREAASAFGDDTVFVERYVERPRHIEVQVFGDQHGNVVHLFERECSIQRRHQKIVEESPSPFVDDDLRHEMGRVAVLAARTIGYVGAGTVEFIVAPTSEFFFLEMNTRLQVEHPVTEMVTGLDLVRLQLEVAEGRSLPPRALRPTLTGHAIEVRLYAEDPSDDYRPSPGRVHTFDPPTGHHVRVDSGVESGGEVSAHYDPMMAKFVAHDADRETARRQMTTMLRRTRIHGVVINRDLLLAILGNDEFVRGDIDTAFLERNPPAELVRTVLAEADVRLAAVVASFAASAAAADGRAVLRSVPSGWRNNASQLTTRRYATPIGALTVGYGTGLTPHVEVDGEPLTVRLVGASAERVDLVVDGTRREFTVCTFGDEVYVDGAGVHVAMRALPRFPDPTAHLHAGSLIVPMPGTIVRVEVVVGDHVLAGQLLVVVEAMKMEHQVKAPAAGVVEQVLVTVGQAVDAGTVLAVIGEGGPGNEGAAIDG